MFFKTEKNINIPTIFITNSMEKDRGSSLYLICEDGTIRFSGSNRDGRQATLFIRPYLVIYMPVYREKLILNKAGLGLVPFEAEALTYKDLYNLYQREEGHLGNVITEIITFDDLLSESFVPKSWQGSDFGGTDWSTAKQKLLAALDEIKAKGMLFSKEDKVLSDAAAADEDGRMELEEEIPLRSSKFHF